MQKYKIILFIVYKTTEIDQRPKFKSRKTENRNNSLCSQIWHWFTKFNKRQAMRKAGH